MLAKSKKSQLRAFNKYDWTSDKDWGKHISRILPEPNEHRLRALKGHWYKIFVDRDFDLQSISQNDSRKREEFYLYDGLLEF